MRVSVRQNATRTIGIVAEAGGELATGPTKPLTQLLILERQTGMFVCVVGSVISGLFLSAPLNLVLFIPVSSCPPRAATCPGDEHAPAVVAYPSLAAAHCAGSPHRRRTRAQTQLHHIDLLASAVPPSADLIAVLGTRVLLPQPAAYTQPSRALPAPSTAGFHPPPPTPPSAYAIPV